MIRFVDMREAEIEGYRFAFFDTVRNEFLRICGSEAWDDIFDLEADISMESQHATIYELGGMSRLFPLIPDWARSREPSEE